MLAVREQLYCNIGTTVPLEKCFKCYSLFSPIFSVVGGAGLSGVVGSMWEQILELFQRKTSPASSSQPSSYIIELLN